MLARGVKVTGATCHFVDEGTDTGPIILQKAVEVKPVSYTHLDVYKRQGIEKGANKMLFTLVTKGKLDIDTAAEEAGVLSLIHIS